jgi:integrase
MIEITRHRRFKQSATSATESLALSDIWSVWYERWECTVVNDALVGKRSAIVGTCLMRLSRASPQLARGIEPNVGSVSPEELLKKIQTGLPPRDYTFASQFLRAGIRSGNNEKRWQLPVPQLDVFYNREPAAFTVPDFADLARLRRIQLRLFHDINEHFSGSRTHAGAAMALLLPLMSGRSSTAEHLLILTCSDAEFIDTRTGSLVVLNREPAVDIPSAHDLYDGESQVNSPPDMRSEAVSLTVPPPAEHAQSVIVLAPPVAILLKQFANRFPLPIFPLWTMQRDVDRVIAAFFSDWNSTEFDTPKDWVMWLSWCQISHRLTLPGFLILTGSGKLNCTELDLPSWFRVYTGARLLEGSDGISIADQPVATESSVTYADQSRYASSSEASDERIPTPAAEVRQDRLYVELVSVIRKATESKTRQSSGKLASILEAFADTRRSDLSSALFHLTCWAAALLSGGSLSGQGLRPSTTLRYVRAIGRNLLLNAERAELSELAAEDFEELYEGVFALTTEKGPIVSSCLVSFHGYLQRVVSASPIDFKSLDGFTTGGGRVDANVITHAEYRCALGCLKSRLQRDEGANTEDVLVTMILLVLGFKLGLRRREASLLRRGDFHDGRDPEVLVRGSRFAATKSSASIRRVPILPFFSSDETALLRRFMKLRIEQGCEVGGLLFSDDARGRTPKRLDGHFHVVSTILRSVTNDARLVFHHLRHSFVNWTLVQMLIGMGTIVPAEDDLAALRSEAFSVGECRRVFQYFFEEVGLSHVHGGRRILFQVAALVGHASPEVTLRHYTHLTSWILAKIAAQAGLNASDSTLLELCTAPRTRVRAKFTNVMNAITQSQTSSAPEMIGKERFQIALLRFARSTHKKSGPSQRNIATIYATCEPVSAEALAAMIPSRFAAGWTFSSVIAAFKHAAAVHGEAERLRSTAGVPNHIIARWIRNLAELQTVHSTGMRAQRPLDIEFFVLRTAGDLPRGVFEQCMLRANTDVTVRAADEFLCRRRAGNNSVCFHDNLKAAARFVADLIKLGVARSRVTGTLLCASDIDTEAQKIVAANTLGLPVGQVVIRKRKTGYKMAKGAWLLDVQVDTQQSGAYKVQSRQATAGWAIGLIAALLVRDLQFELPSRDK